MAAPRILILRAPGTNCDQETAFAFEKAGGIPHLVHIQRLLENPKLSDAYQILCLPGGFSYGDDIAAGKILANQIRQHLNDALVRFKTESKLILGICNGLQVLIKSGILLPDDGQAVEATLTWNDSGRFEDRWVNLAVTGDCCVLLRGIDRLYLPVAHAEGKFVVRDEETLSSLDARGQLSLRYCRPSGCQSNGRVVPYPENPNGSVANVAGICDTSGRVFGLMPHPERYVDRTHHPRWTRERLPDRGDGLQIFENAVQYFTP